MLPIWKPKKNTVVLIWALFLSTFLHRLGPKKLYSSIFAVNLARACKKFVVFRFKKVNELALKPVLRRNLILYCKWNTYILFVGEMLPSTDDMKMCQAIWNENQTMTSPQKPVLHKSLGKGAQYFAEFNTLRVTKFRPTHPPGGSKMLSSAFSQIWDT